MFRSLLYFIAGVLVFFAIIGLALFFAFAPRIPKLPDDLKLLASSPPTEVYARDGELITSIGGRNYVSLDQVSPHFQNAIVAVEDKRFYDHYGVDIIATARSLYYNLVTIGGGPGGSTITQQLAKNLFFTFERSWKRKLLEALAAFAIEDKFTKAEILEVYSNLVYFGRYSYGVENAALTYFDKHASELGLHEAAMLAGLPNSPSRLNPLHNFEGAKERQALALQRMVANDMITEAEMDSAMLVPVELNRKPIPRKAASYPLDYALEFAGGKIGKDAINYGGVKITTTLDPLLQAYAEEAVETGIAQLKERLRPLPEEVDTRLEGALVAIEAASGQILAMVGGHNHSETQFNRVLHAPRHPGSAFKPIVYLTAIEKGVVTPATVLIDEKIELPIDKRRVWKPNNFDNEFRGPVTVKYGLMKSINTIAAQLIYKVTPYEVVETARRLGMDVKLEPLLSLALGAQEITPLEMAKAYSTIAREGVVIDPHFVKRIEGQSRNLLYENLTAPETRFAQETVYILIDMMRGVIDDGTGVIVRRRGMKGDIIGKTGTSSDFKDAWFCGATPSIVCVVWVGCDDNRPMYLQGNVGVVGAVGAAPIWIDFMQRATAGEPARSFPRPEGVSTLFMNPITGEVSQIPEEQDWIPFTVKDKQAEKMLEEKEISLPADTTDVAG